jgi:transcription initiation factor TFIIIB Brf1 subunit/transcription initiation factor TFIIB
MISQKIGHLNSKKFTELLESFDEEPHPKPQSFRISEQLILRRNNMCYHCHRFDCVSDPEIGGIICTNCGRLNDEIFDSSNEWRCSNYDDPRKTDQSRVGMPVNEYFMKASLSTTIQGYGNQAFRQFHKYNSMDYDERSLLKNFQYMDNSAEDLVPEAVKEHAKKLYKRISDNENKRGAKKHSNMAACVYFASEGRNFATDIEAISSNFNIKKKKFTKGCNFYREQLFEKEPEYYAKMKPVSAEDEIMKIGAALNLPEMYKNITRYVAHMAQELGIVLKNTPVSIAVGAIQLVCATYQLEIDKKDISSKCEISETTIHKSFTLLSNYKNYLIPTKKLFDKYMEMRSPSTPA